MIADDVTVEHLLAISVHLLAATEGFLAVLDGLPDQVRGRRAILVRQRRLCRAGLRAAAGGDGKGSELS